MKKLKTLAVCAFLIFFMAACGSIQVAWDNATPDEKARFVVNELKQTLDELHTIAKEHKAIGGDAYYLVYKGEILPVFDKAYKALYAVSTLGKMATERPPTPLEIRNAVRPFIYEIVKLLQDWRVIS